MSELRVVKIGGSLFDLPQLGPALTAWLSSLAPKQTLLLAGGGLIADAIRNLHAIHQLSEADSHEIAMASLNASAMFLAKLLRLPIVYIGSERPEAFRWPLSQTLIADVSCFQRECREEYQLFATLPQDWTTTSDALSVATAIVLEASEVIFLKSTSIPSTTDWNRIAAGGWLDPVAGRLLMAHPEIAVRWVNFRQLVESSASPDSQQAP